MHFLNLTTHRPRLSVHNSLIIQSTVKWGLAVCVPVHSDKHCLEDTERSTAPSTASISQDHGHINHAQDRNTWPDELHPVFAVTYKQCMCRTFNKALSHLVLIFTKNSINVFYLFCYLKSISLYRKIWTFGKRNGRPNCH